MDAEHFDRLVRRVTSERSRRGLLGVLGSAALAIGVGVARPQPAEARCRRGANCTKGRYTTCNDNPNCFRAKNVDTGRCACVRGAPCGGDPCTTGTDCASGEVCVVGKGCCNDTGWCAESCPTV